MRLWIMSDLHLEIAGYAPPTPSPGHDVLVVAGDLHAPMSRGVGWLVEHGLTAKPIIYIGGNHEFYGNTRDAGLAEARKMAQSITNLHILQDSALVIAGVRFLGTTLWTDYALRGEAWQAIDRIAAERDMNDHAQIRLAEAGHRLWSGADAAAEHARSRQWLESELARPFAGPTVVVTHHAPSRGSIARRFHDHPLNPAFVSNLDGLVATADLWIHGHVHVASRYAVDRCRVVCNPRGYVWQDWRGDRLVTLDEDTGFDPCLIVEF